MKWLKRGGPLPTSAMASGDGMLIEQTFTYEINVENRSNMSKEEVARRVEEATAKERAILEAKVRTIATCLLMYGEDRSDMVPEE